MKMLAIVLIIRAVIALFNRNGKKNETENITRNEVQDPAAFRLRY